LNPKSANQDRLLEAGTVVANNYRVTERLGAGGMGTVYLAQNVTLDQRVVVKVLRGSQAGAGHEEAQMLANLQHPNVVTVYAHDVARDCIVMEFLDGASLSTLLEKGIDRVNAIRVALAIAEALAAVHRRGLVHRDLKPDNVMLALNSGGGRLVDWLKLIDFGLALKAGKKPPVLLGTPDFCGPEQFRADQPAHPGNDVYALGVTIYLMMTGEYPFVGEPHEVAALHAEQPPPSMLEALKRRPGVKLDPRSAALLEDLDELLQQMLAKDVSKRPPAQEVARRLTRLESTFAEAGTFVGAASPLSSQDLQPVTSRHSRTSMLRVGRATASDASSTAPDLAPARVHPTTDPIPRPAPSSEPDLPPPPRSNRGLIAVLALLVVALAAGVALLPSRSTETPTSPPVEPTPPVAKPTPAPEPSPSPSPTEPTPEPAVTATLDAGAPDELVGLSSVKKHPPKPPRVAECVLDRDKLRGEFHRLSKLIPEPDQFEDQLADALNKNDCRRAEAVITQMQTQLKSKASPTP